MKMKKVGMLFGAIIIGIALLCSGCSKAGSKNKENNKKVIKSDYIIPDYSDLVILSDLNNVDLEYYPGQLNTSCDFRIISTRKLDMDKIDIQFDSDLDFKKTVSEDTTNENVFFDYNLLLAYNSLKSEDGVSTIDELPMGEYDKVKEGLNLYSYYVDCVFDLSDKKNYEDAEINNVYIKYDGKEYKNEIGRIIVNDKLLNVEEADVDKDFIALHCPEAFYQTFYYDKNGEFSYSDYTGVFETFDEPVTLKNARFINGQTIELESLELEIITGDKTVNTVWEPGDELKIPAKSTVNIMIIGKSDKIKNHCGFKANPITEFEFESKGDTVKEYIKVSGTIYEFNKYEEYAVLHDNIDIFESYYNVLGGEQE
ncbi:MAG: hypothetical protein K6G64_08720 [Eubacterium sp.]|nr:hypothetical protein [Eubacterium sp.]